MGLKTRDSRVTLVNSYPLSLISLHKEQSQLFVTSHWNRDHKWQRGSFSEALPPGMRRRRNLLPAIMKQRINFAHQSLHGSDLTILISPAVVMISLMPLVVIIVKYLIVAASTEIVLLM